MDADMKDKRKGKEVIKKEKKGDRVLPPFHLSGIHQ
jgi:hypothetical protein